MCAIPNRLSIIGKWIFSKHLKIYNKHRKVQCDFISLPIFLSLIPYVCVSSTNFPMLWDDLSIFHLNCSSSNCQSVSLEQLLSFQRNFISNGFWIFLNFVSKKASFQGTQNIPSFERMQMSKLLFIENPSLCMKWIEFVPKCFFSLSTARLLKISYVSFISIIKFPMLLRKIKQ